jgi:hypothetical protein
MRRSKGLTAFLNRRGSRRIDCRHAMTVVTNTLTGRLAGTTEVPQFQTESSQRSELAFWANSRRHAARG